jgi:hypothetical protein
VARLSRCKARRFVENQDFKQLKSSLKGKTGMDGSRWGDDNPVSGIPDSIPVGNMQVQQ